MECEKFRGVVCVYTCRCGCEEIIIRLFGFHTGDAVLLFNTKTIHVTRYLGVHVLVCRLHS